MEGELQGNEGNNAPSDRRRNPKRFFYVLMEGTRGTQNLKLL